MNSNSPRVELRLALAPRQLERLRHDPLLGKAREPVALSDVYFDTPRFALWRRGMALRLREQGKRRQQNVISGSVIAGGVHRQIEITSAIAGAAPDLQLIADEELRRRVSRTFAFAPPAPVFSVELLRESRSVAPLPGLRLEVHFDCGAIRSGARHRAISELALELKAGAEWQLFEFALKIAERFPLAVEHRSVVERGRELAAGARPAPERVRIGVARPGMSANAAFAAICASCLDHLQRNRRGALTDTNPEYVHQMRVALRRLRSALGAYVPLIPADALEAPVAAVRALARALGPAREWDVFIESSFAPALARSPGHRGLQAMEKAIMRLRQDAHRQAHRAIASRDYQRLALSLGGWLARQDWRRAADPRTRQRLDAPATRHAAAVLERCYRRARRRGRRPGKLDLPQLHRLRIAVKKLRYAAGFHAPLFENARLRPMQKALDRLQNILGAINDCAAAPALIEAARRAARGPLRREACALLLEQNAARLKERRRRLKRAWKQFCGCKRFWRRI